MKLGSIPAEMGRFSRGKQDRVQARGGRGGRWRDEAEWGGGGRVVVVKIGCLFCTYDNDTVLKLMLEIIHSHKKKKKD